MKFFMKALALFIALCIFIACDDDTTDAPTESPNFTLETDKHDVNYLLEVKYNAYQTGNGKFNEIQYITDEGEQTVTEPVLPWSSTDTVNIGKTVYMKAKGALTKGSVDIILVGKRIDGISSASFTFSDEKVR